MKSVALVLPLLLACPASNSNNTGMTGQTGNTGATGPTASTGTTGTTAATGEAVTGHFYYTQGGEVFRIAAASGAVAENISTRLDTAMGANADAERRLNASVNGEWMTLESSHFGCSGCLVRINKAVSAGEPVKPDGNEVFLEGLAAINGAGDVVVYAASGGTHLLDLYKTTRNSAGVWSAAVELTVSSNKQYNNMPSLSFDGQSVAFDCGDDRDPETGNNDACSVGINGGAVTRLVGTSPSPSGVSTPARNTYVQNPHFGLDGLYFEGSWPFDGKSPETIWLLATGAVTPTPIGRNIDNAVAPCTLRDGRFGALWLGRAGNAAGAHELTVMARDGTNPITLTPNLDVDDAGVGCSD
jgi:hypothetical protein